MRYLFLLILIAGMILFGKNKNLTIISSFSNTISITDNNISENNRLQQKAKEALDFCTKNKYNTDFCILIDMSIHSGKNRFFVYDFNSQKVIKEMLVSHGCGQNPWYADFSKENPKFSNQDGSHLSSLGKYKIGKRGYSNWGINVNYQMFGLDATNSNAFKRQIVLHGWEAVSDQEIYPAGTPEGWGCPAISNNSMRYVDEMLKKTDKAVLMWMFK